MENSRIVIIKENGDADIIFSCYDNGCENLLSIKKDDDISKIYEFEESIKGKIFNDPNTVERHYIYMHDYLKTHFVDEFKRIKVNPTLYSDIRLISFFISELNNIVLINTGVRHNILIIPNVGLNDDELTSLEKITSIFSRDVSWDIHDNVHFETEEVQGEKYKILNPGEPYKYSLEQYIQEKKNDEGKRL